MNALFVAVVAALAVAATAAPGGIHGGAVLSGPAGVVTSHGAIGPVGVGLGLGHGVALAAAPAVALAGPVGHGAAIAGPVSPGAVISGPVNRGAVISGPVNHGAVLTAPVHHGTVLAAPAIGLGLGNGLGLGLGNGLGLGLGGHGLGLGVGIAGVGIGHGIGHGVAAITNGGGTIAATGHGAAIRGPATAPVVVAGPAGKIAADGLWGPTANIGLTHGHGHGW